MTQINPLLNLLFSSVGQSSSSPFNLLAGQENLADGSTPGFNGLLASGQTGEVASEELLGALDLNNDPQGGIVLSPKLDDTVSPLGLGGLNNLDGEALQAAKQQYVGAREGRVPPEVINLIAGQKLVQGGEKQGADQSGLLNLASLNEVGLDPAQDADFKPLIDQASKINPSTISKDPQAQQTVIAPVAKPQVKAGAEIEIKEFQATNANSASKVSGEGELAGTKTNSEFNQLNQGFSQGGAAQPQVNAEANAAAGKPAIEDDAIDANEELFAGKLKKLDNIHKQDNHRVEVRQVYQHQQENPVNQVKVRIQQGIENGLDKIRINLVPVELGSVDVELEMADEGVQVRVVAERGETLDLLKRDSEELARALREAGIKAGEDSMEFALGKQGGGDQDFGEAPKNNEYFIDVPELNAMEELSKYENMSGQELVLAAKTEGIDIQV